MAKSLLLPYVSSSLGAFRVLHRDYEALLEYVEPADANRNTYSHRTYELLLRACTEFEGLCKETALDRGIVSRAESANINDLSSLYDNLDLGSTAVGVSLWQPKPVLLKPVEGWKNKPHGLHWYRAYNTVKHNRSSQFAEATLWNVTCAVAACFLILYRLGGVRSDEHEHPADGGTDFLFLNCSLTIRE